MRVLLALVVLAFLLTACDSAEERRGEFVGTLSGAEARTLRWEATFGDGRDLVLAGWEEGAIAIYPPPEYVEPGRYSIARSFDLPNDFAQVDTFGASLRLYPPDEMVRGYVATSGELVLDSVGPEEIRGTIRFSARNQRDSTRVVEVEGEFVSVFTPFCC